MPDVSEVNTPRTAQAIPPDAVRWRVRLRGGGGPGGRGAYQSGASRSGGGGGGGGAYLDTGWRDVAELGGTYSVTRGAAGQNSVFTSGSVSLTAGAGAAGQTSTSAASAQGGAGGTVAANIALQVSESGGAGGASGISPFSTGQRNGLPGADTNLAGPGGGGGAYQPNMFNTDRGGNGGSSAAVAGANMAAQTSGIAGQNGADATTGSAGGGAGGGGINGGNSRSGANGGASGAGGSGSSAGLGTGKDTAGVGAAGETIVEFMVPGLGLSTGAYQFGGAAAGVRPTAGDGAGSYRFDGAGSGRRDPAGSAAGAYTLSSAGAAGVKQPAGAGGGAYRFDGSAAGSKPSAGSAAGSYRVDGSAAGVEQPAGASAGTYAFDGAAAGAKLLAGAGSGEYRFDGAAVGQRAPVGAAGGGYRFDGAAAGQRASAGTSAGTYAFDGAATGLQPILEDRYGTAAGTYTLGGAAAGAATRAGAAAGTYAFGRGTVDGSKPSQGQAPAGFIDYATDKWFLNPAYWVDGQSGALLELTDEFGPRAVKMTQGVANQYGMLNLRRSAAGGGGASIPVSAGQTWVIRAKVRLPATNTANDRVFAQLSVYGAGMPSQYPNTGASALVGINDTWTQIEREYTIPDGYTYMTAAVYFHIDADPGNVAYVRDAEVLLKVPGGYRLDGSAAGRRDPRGATAGQYALDGAAAGTKPSRGATAGDYRFDTLDVAGVVERQGATSGGYALDGAAAGTTSRAGAAMSTYSLDGAAAGETQKVGYALVGAYRFDIFAAAGTKPSRGATAGDYRFDGLASGPGVSLFPTATVGSLVGLNFNLPSHGRPADYMPLWLGGIFAGGGPQPAPYTIRQVLYPASNDPDSIDDGVDEFDKWARSTPGRKIGFGHSQGAQALSRWMRKFRNDPTAPGPDELMFVLTGNPLRSNGGGYIIGRPEVGGQTGVPTPTDTPWRIVDVARRYDGFADWPTRPTGIARTNATRGMFTTHVRYAEVDLFDKTHQISTDGNTTYVLTREDQLPYIDAVLFGSQVPASVVEKWRNTIEDAYDTHGAAPPEPPEPSSLWWRLVLAATGALT